MKHFARLARVAVLEKLVDGKQRPDPKSIQFPEAIHSDPNVQQFLRSAQATYVWRCGHGIAHARHVANGISGARGLYSAQATARGSGANASVHIQKTSDYSRNRAAQYDKDVAELTELRKILGRSSANTTADKSNTTADKRPLAANNNNLHGDGPPAKKKNRPPPKDADVIVIDD
eukprot:CAMPEP_0198667964 /NCGR_PEP_ID=MMETSP1467-20131203/70658_1 /TAXON_ID=1462469 /ORGANISM="unid. sp., Strain CCMP2135" /LENGTH=174 /DNA_ID=CAMNT_0044404675 /DNA_START=66 /DNA_END=590 /DNA_ORIENTATION=-